MPTVSLDTVYRTLWMLNDLGLTTTLGPRRDSMRFDANLARHHHYVCVRCGLVRDFESAKLNVLPVPSNTPVFFLRDPLKFPDLNHAVKRDPRTNLRRARNNWDVWTSLPQPGGVTGD